VRKMLALALAWSAAVTIVAAAAKEWGAADARAILDKTLVLRLAPPVDHLEPGERAALDALLAAGPALQRLYERQLHAQAEEARRAIPAGRTDLADLFRLFQGPIANTLDNERKPFLPVRPEEPGKAFYPAGATREGLDSFIGNDARTRAELLDPRSVVRGAADLEGDLLALDRRPDLAALHPGLRERMRGPLYAIPYALAYAPEQDEAGRHLLAAAAAVEDEDPDFADYLRNRRRDFLTNDYESGDASWVAGSFRNLNAQIGSYETYDDELFGVKTSMSLSVLVRDEERTRALRAALRGIQAIEDALPYPAPHRRVRENLPVGVYNVAADFGQARGTNTASILPNESRLTRKYGRTILLRYNVMTHQDLFAISQAMWAAAMAPEQAGDLGEEGGFYRTLWHEIGHYLGVDRDRQGRDLGQALQENADLLEEMKADLVSLFAAAALQKTGDFDEARLKDIYASGILRTLQKSKPRRGQPYQTMQLMQMNFFLERGLLAFDDKTGRLRVRYERYPETVAALLERVLSVQAAGDTASADAFIEQYTTWTPELHERVAASMRATERFRYRLVRYQALGE
jgi:Zincin-like metallopeptidase